MLHSLRALIRRMPGLRRAGPLLLLVRFTPHFLLRGLGTLLLARKVPGALEAFGLTGRVLFSGGVAYDARRGRLTRLHKDIDLAALREDHAVVEACLRSLGITLKDEGYRAWGLGRWGNHVDVYFWDEAGDARVEYALLKSNLHIVVQMPRTTFLEGQSCRLLGVRLVVLSDAALRCIVPLLLGGRDTPYLSSLPDRGELARLPAHSEAGQLYAYDFAG